MHTSGGVDRTVDVLAVALDADVDVDITVDVLVVTDVRTGALAVVLITTNISVAGGAVVVAVVTPPTMLGVRAVDSLCTTPSPPPSVPSDSGTVAPLLSTRSRVLPPGVFSLSNSSTLNNNFCSHLA